MQIKHGNTGAWYLWRFGINLHPSIGSSQDLYIDMTIEKCILENNQIALFPCFIVIQNRFNLKPCFSVNIGTRLKDDLFTVIPYHRHVKVVEYCIFSYFVRISCNTIRICSTASFRLAVPSDTLHGSSLKPHQCFNTWNRRKWTRNEYLSMYSRVNAMSGLKRN